MAMFTSLFKETDNKSVNNNDKVVKEVEKVAPVQVAPTATTLITPSMTINGNISTKDNVQVEGFVKGDISCKELEIKNKVQGDINAENVAFSGAKVKGKVNATNSVTIDEKSVVLGDINSGSAQIDGSVKGNIDIKLGVTLASTSIIAGDVLAVDILTEKGAMITGKLIVRGKVKDLNSLFSGIEGEFNE